MDDDDYKPCPTCHDQRRVWEHTYDEGGQPLSYDGRPCPTCRVALEIQMGHGFDAVNCTMGRSCLQRVKLVSPMLTLELEIDLARQVILNQHQLPIRFPKDRIDFMFERLVALWALELAKPGWAPLPEIPPETLRGMLSLMGSEHNVKLWIQLPNPALDGHTPLEYWDKGGPEKLHAWVQNLLVGQA